MSSITVVDVNEEAKQEVVEEPTQIEEATEQTEHEVSCSIREPTNEVVDNPPVEEVEKTKEEPKQEEQPKPKELIVRPVVKISHKKITDTDTKKYVLLNLNQ